MKKIYSAPVVKEIKINIEQQICTGSTFDIDPEAPAIDPGSADGKFDFDGGSDFGGFEEWSFNWEE